MLRQRVGKVAALFGQLVVSNSERETTKADVEAEDSRITIDVVRTTLLHLHGAR